MPMSPGRRRLVWIAVGVGATGVAVALVWMYVADWMHAADRFAKLDRRLDALTPKDRGAEAMPLSATDAPAIRVVLERLSPDDPENAQTRIRVGDSEWLLPKGPPTGDEKASTDVFRLVEAKIAELHAKAPKLKGEIETPPPKGGSVPHLDIMRVLDAFLAAGVSDVNFQGASSPLKAGVRPK